MRVHRLGSNLYHESELRKQKNKYYQIPLINLNIVQRLSANQDLGRNVIVVTF